MTPSYAPAATRPLHRPDLIGMREADKLPDSGPGSYRFVEHRRYFAVLLEALDVTVVVHDWLVGLGIAASREQLCPTLQSFGVWHQSEHFCTAARSAKERTPQHSQKWRALQGLAV